MIFHSCGDDVVVDAITLNWGLVNFSFDGESKNFTLLNPYIIDNEDSTVLLAFGNVEDEILTFGFTTSTSFPVTLSGEDSYLASNSELLDAGSVALTITSNKNGIMTVTFSMAAILISDYTSATDLTIITNGIFEDIVISGF